MSDFNHASVDFSPEGIASRRKRNLSFEAGLVALALAALLGLWAIGNVLLPALGTLNAPAPEQTRQQREAAYDQCIVDASRSGRATWDNMAATIDRCREAHL